MANVIIQGGTFNSAQGDFHINNKDSGLHILRLGVSLGAIHDSAERYPPPNCHPDTRKAVRQIILDWIDNESSPYTSFWLYGPAGAGKTAILQAIAEFLCSPSGSGQSFGASFFFSRGKQGRDQGYFLFSTIGYQLALIVPGLRQHVNRIMELNPTLHTKSMVVQLQTLIVDPFKNLSPLPQRSYLVIIDGLDECHDKLDQQLILRLLCETITVHKLPLRFLIGSRPESHIRESFDQESLYTITRRVVLDETFDPGRDIQVFLQDGFAKICAGNPILSRVEQPWPSKGIIDLLVQRSSGQFIYAATVLKFVAADFCSPTEQLALVLKPDPMAFSDLDQLYTQILSVYPSAENIVQILGIVSVSQGVLAEVIEDIFEMEEGKVKLMLRGLSSLMKDENGESLNKGVIIPHFIHASFRDYLFDSSRSGPFHVDQQVYENEFTTRSFTFIMQSIRSWGMSSITRVLHTTTWDYFTSRHGLPVHFSRSSKVVKEAIMTDINDLVHEFRRTSINVGASFFAMLGLFKILKGCFDNIIRADLTQSDLDGTDLRAKLVILIDAYRGMLDLLFSKSKDLGGMVEFLPGIVVQKDMSMQGMADLYRIKPDLLERLIKFTMAPLKQFPPSYRLDDYRLDDYLSSFLKDRKRSQLYYCDPIHQHISICRHFLSLLDGSNDPDLQSYELSDYVSSHFYHHLYGATWGLFYAQNLSDEPLAVKFVHDLETTAYYVDEKLSGNILMRHIIRAILKWANPMIGASSVQNFGLRERQCHLTTKIYREILCMTKHKGTTYITMGTGGPNHGQASAFPWTSQYRIVLSWDLLAWMLIDLRISLSFTYFITTSELVSGPLYITPDIFYTQVIEYLLEKTYNLPSTFGLFHCFQYWHWIFMEHFPRVFPTEMILYLLRSTPSECVKHHFAAQSVLECIIKWLQGLGPRRPSDLYDRFQGELLQLQKALEI